ncbi:SCO family protein [Photobacterium sp. ZSDE20]|uniref:SCO family protein n=1 Tax=Photobacterium pectinilyticum TaxID=2906793 RepID=A0ABT1N4V7_9GAMM|nr:SCO family protein [Photobacterium sp. ZSDE20]MCQ1059157.1 SCO family protein [Photobacterium sp. ZSDE20]MDD1824388.1 SCO family protein [Photobacterium sp. ZSDE20]
MKYQWIILALALTAGLITSVIVDRQSPVAQTSEPLNLLKSGKENVDLYDPNDQRIRVIYFGYTHCPDVCPTSLAVLSAALKQIDDQQINQLWPIFITLDPERDTPEKSAQYAQYFHKKIIGMTGNAAQTKALAEKYGVLYMRTELEGSALEYAVDHSSYFYFLRADGTLVEKVQHTLNPNILVDAINRVLAEDKVPV